MNQDPSWKGKQPMRDYDHPFHPAHASSFQYASSLHSTTTSQSHKSRGSIIVAASDALSTFKFRRRPKSLRRQSAIVKNAPIILPEVIEISAARIAEDNQERLRLRDAAAQSLGLGPVLQPELTGPTGYGSLDDEEGGARAQDDGSPVEQSVDPHSPFTSHQSSTSFKLSHSNALHSTHSRTNSSTFSPTTSTSTSASPIPTFPATPADLFQYIQKSSILPKFYPPPSIRIFSFNKQWKLRHVVFTSPPSARASYLHLFKATKRLNDQASREIELERLEIDENSVVHVAEEELVGGRKGVIKVGGTEAGIVKKDAHTSQEDVRTTWILQVEDQREAQKWIEAIKGSIFQLKSMRAGLGSVTQGLSSTEPRGDMDVMLSLRAQSMYIPPSSSPTSTGHAHFGKESRRPPTSASMSTEASSSSGRGAGQSTASNGAPSRALKGLFGGRSRSPSGASMTDPRANSDRSEDSFGVMGNNLLSMMKSTNNSSSTFASTSNHAPSGSNGIYSSASIIDRKIALSGSLPYGGETSHPPSLHDSGPFTPPSTPRSPEKAPRALSLQIPLQPPPRKRWTAVETEQNHNRISEDDLLSRPNPTIQRNFYGSAAANGSLSAVGGADAVTSDRASALSTPRAPSVQSVSVSIQSVSSLASAGGSSPVTSSGGRPSAETKRSSRRWSRQGTLPQRMTPPSGPPPASPSSASPTQSLPGIPSASAPHPYSSSSLSGRARSRSSVHSAASDQSVVSGLPNFTNRNSIASSIQSVGQSSYGAPTHLHPNAAVHSRASSSHRASMPPPRGPAPTSALPPAPATTRRGSRRDSEPPKPSSSFASQPPSTTISSPISRLRDRAFRISMLEPRPPPLSNLPPRPDEHHSSSPPTSPGSVPLSPIPASPIPPPLQPESLVAESRNSTPPAAVASTSRHTSLKKRLRILSAPASAPTSPLPSQPLALAAAHALRNSLQLQRRDSASPSHTPPGTPLGEHIAHPKVQNDPSFITGTVLPTTPSPNTPYFPQFDGPSSLKNSSARLSNPGLPPPESEDIYPGFQSLSPPPRRMSKQLTPLDIKEHVPSPLHGDEPSCDTGDIADSMSRSSPGAGAGKRESLILTPADEPADILTPDGEMDDILTDNLSRRDSTFSEGIIIA